MGAGWLVLKKMCIKYIYMHWSVFYTYVNVPTSKYHVVADD